MLYAHQKLYCVCVLHVCCGAPILNQHPYWCLIYMTLFWYILITYQYVQVCTIIHFLYRHTCRYQVCTCMYWQVLDKLFLHKSSLFQMQAIIGKLHYHASHLISATLAIPQKQSAGFFVEFLANCSYLQTYHSQC